MAYDDVADAESLGDEEYYDDEYDDEEEEELLFGLVPRTPGLIAIFAIIVVLLLLTAALFSANFGFVGGIDGLTVNIPNQEGDLLDEKLDIEAYTETPTFGRKADGDGDLTIYYDGEAINTWKISFTDGKGAKSIPYEDFYVDNGEYKAEVTLEGYTESDTITLQRTAHYMGIAQKDYTAFEEERIRYKISLLPDDENVNAYNIIYVPGEGHIQVYYVEDESEQEERTEWEPVLEIDLKTDFTNFEYKFPGEDTENRSSNEGYFLDFQEYKLTEQKGDGYYSMEVYFTNTYGLVDKGAFTDEITAMPEQNPESSYTWIYLEE